MPIAHLHHTSHEIVHCLYFFAAGMAGEGLYSDCAWVLLALNVLGWILPHKKQEHA